MADSKNMIKATEADRVVDTISLPTGGTHELTESQAGKIVAGALRAEMRTHMKAERLAAAIASELASLAEIKGDENRLNVTIALRRNGALPKVGTVDVKPSK